MRRWIKVVTIAGVSGLTAMVASPSRAATVLASGGTYDGWVVTEATGVSLTADTSNASDLALTKAANFSNLEGLVISFTQVSASAAPTVTFENETLTNNSGSTWGGFQFLIMNPNASAAFVSSATSPFQPAAGYTSGTFASDSVVYAGTQANTATSTWGFNSTGELVIDANPGKIGTTFDLKEIPLTTAQLPGASAGGIPLPIGSPGAVIPLPAAAWQGSMGLLVLGLIAFGKKVAKQAVR
jgi:hypothetical protein